MTRVRNPDGSPITGPAYEYIVTQGASYSLTFAIENPNGPPVEAVRATITTTAPAGWTATASPRDLTLGPRNATFGALVTRTGCAGSWSHIS